MIPGGETLRGLRCIHCGHSSPPTPIAYTCPSCGANQEVEYDLPLVRASWPRYELASEEDLSIWRYVALLPVASRLEGAPVGFTPIVAVPKLARGLAVRMLLIKDEGRNPAASVKARGSAVALVRAREAGVDTVTLASTGNAAAATAALAAGAGFRVRAFVPKDTPATKVAELCMFGAEVLVVDGSYDDAFELSVEAARRFGWYNCNPGYNPFMREGNKTIAFEICEQLGMRAPDIVVVPVGHGNLLSGLWKGFVEFAEIGLIETRPRLVAVQAAGSAAVAQAARTDGVIRPAAGTTIAESIAVTTPHDGEAALRAIRESRGFGVIISDEEIAAAVPELAQRSGMLLEPAAAAAYAGLKRAAAEGLLLGAGITVLVATGSGLKHTGASGPAATAARLVSPDPASLEGLFPAAPDREPPH